MFSSFPTRSRKSVLLGLSGLLLLGISAAAHAQVASYSVTDWVFQGDQGGQRLNYTLGYTFTPTTDIAVTSLGEWISIGDTFNDAETLGIFDSNNTLLFSTSYTLANATISGNTLASGNEFRYTDITAAYSQAVRTLSANQSYTVAGTVGNNSYATQAADLTSSPDITITSGGLYGPREDLTDPASTPPNSAGNFNMYEPFAKVFER